MIVVGGKKASQKLKESKEMGKESSMIFFFFFFLRVLCAPLHLYFRLDVRTMKKKKREYKKEISKSV